MALIAQDAKRDTFVCFSKLIRVGHHGEVRLVFASWRLSFNPRPPAPAIPSQQMIGLHRAFAAPAVIRSDMDQVVRRIR